MILSFLSGKGGTGKTTLSINIADTLARRGKSVVLIDGDPQGSARDWAVTRQRPCRFNTLRLPLNSVHTEVDRFRRGIAFDYIIIDSPPRMADQTRSILIASDLVVMPVSPSAFDVWAVQKTIQQVNAIRQFKANLRMAFLVNRRMADSAIGRAVVKALAQFEIPILDSVINEHAIFSESAATGLTVFEMDPRSPACAELQAVTDELLLFDSGYRPGRQTRFVARAAAPSQPAGAATASP